MIDLEVWEKIVDAPLPEVDALFKRKELTFADFHDDPISWHMQAVVWGVLRALHEGFHDYEFEQQEPGESEYRRWGTLAVRTFSLGILRAIREHADEMTPLLEARKSRDQKLQDQIAERIRAELVCCDIAQQLDACFDGAPEMYDAEWMEQAQARRRAIRRSPGYHAICEYGELAAQIAQGN